MIEALNDFEEQSRTIFNWLRENLKQVALFVKIHQDPQLLQLDNAGGDRNPSDIYPKQRDF